MPDEPVPPDGTSRIVMVVNAVLVGVPAAYALSGSVPVTLIAAAAALVLVVIHLLARGLARSAIPMYSPTGGVRAGRPAWSSSRRRPSWLPDRQAHLKGEPHGRRHGASDRRRTSQERNLDVREQTEIHAGENPRIPFDDFYRRQFVRLIGFMITMGATPVEAEDAAQEAMKSALIAWPGLRDPRAYVRQAATGAFFRSRNRDRDRPGRESEAARLHHRTVAEVVFDDEVRLVLDLLRGLPPAQREVMAWTVDGYSPAEIATFTGKNPATVRTNLGHARKALRLICETTGEEGSYGP